MSERSEVDFDNADESDLSSVRSSNEADSDIIDELYSEEEDEMELDDELWNQYTMARRSQYWVPIVL